MACSECGGPTRFVEQYNQHWCDRCQAYRGPDGSGGKKKGVNLWLVVGLPIAAVALIFGALLWQSTRAFKGYMKKSQASEAHENIYAITKGADIYYQVNGELPPAAGPTPPKGACCEHGAGKCEPDPALWTEPGWQNLDFGMYGPHYYSYEFRPSPEGLGFVAYAYGDLDCDGTFSTYSIQTELVDGDTITMPILEHDPLE